MSEFLSAAQAPLLDSAVRKLAAAREERDALRDEREHYFKMAALLEADNAALRVVIGEQAAGLAAAEEELTELRRERVDLRDYIEAVSNALGEVIGEQDLRLTELRDEVERWHNNATNLSVEVGDLRTRLSGLPISEADDQVVNEMVNRATAGRKSRAL